MVQKLVNISIVCASAHGKYKLPHLIKSISDGYYLPNEIIIVATSLSECLLLKKNLNNKIQLIIIISKIKNQIYQRNLGKKKCHNNLIIQSDDDVVFKKDTLKNFFYQNQLSSPRKIIAGYVLCENSSHQSNRYNKIYNNFLIFRILLKILNSFKEVKNFSVLSSGRIVPLVRNIENQRFCNLEWLNSVMMYDKRIVNNINTSTKNSKAYYEDAIFSFFNKLKRFELVISKKIKVYHPQVEKTNFVTFLKSLRGQFILHKMKKKNLFFFVFDILIFFVIFIIYK